MKKLVLLASVCAASALFAADGATIYKKCVACHGKNAEVQYLGKVPALNSVANAERVELMKAYKAGAVEGGKGKFGQGAIMKGQMASLSEEDMKAVSDHIDTLK